MPTLTPVDYNPFGDFYEATGADKPAFEPRAKLIAETLFSAAPTVFKPAMAIMGNPSAFMEGASKSGGAALRSYGEAVENHYVPEGAVKFDDEGNYYDKDGKKLEVQRRPNLLPVTKGKDGFELAMPAMADVWNTLGGAGGKATLGAGPSLRPALKYMDKIYKAKPGEQHLDAIPADLRATFEKQAMSGEDISNFNFGFINHKGHFLQREDALKYAIDHGILDPQDAKYGTLVTTMLNQSGGEGKLASTFFSALEDTVNKIKQNKASGDQWLNTLINSKGVKGEEIETTGLREFLAGKQSVTKSEIEEFLKGARTEINDVWKGTGQNKIEQWKVLKPNGLTDGTYATKEQAEARAFQIGGNVEVGPNMILDNTKYSKWQLPGGENYRELLMTLPADKGPYGQAAVEAHTAYRQQLLNKYGNGIRNKATPEELAHLDDLDNRTISKNPAYKSSHWDEPNILAHMRMNDRTIDGKKSLHLEEIQSDWHQQGREKGYKGQGITAEDKAIRERLRTNTATEADYLAWDNGVGAKFAKDTDSFLVPDAPFKKTWHELALKRAIREAAENGYERLSWTPGEAQAARYDLSKQVDKVKLVPVETAMNGKKINFKLEAYKDNRPVVEQWLQNEDELSSYVGKEAAKKLIENKNQNGASVLEGDGLKVGGEGMKGFYDQIIPKAVEKIAKEFGVKVQKGFVSGGDPEDVIAKWKAKDPNHPIVKKNEQPIFYIDIPPAMRQSVIQKGQPLFSGISLVPINYEPEFEK